MNKMRFMEKTHRLRGKPEKTLEANIRRLKAHLRGKKFERIKEFRREFLKLEKLFKDYMLKGGRFELLQQIFDLNERLLTEYPYHVEAVFHNAEKYQKLVAHLLNIRISLIKLLLQSGEYKAFIGGIAKLMKSAKNKKLVMDKKTHEEIILKSLKLDSEITGGARIKLLGKKAKIEVSFEDKEKGGITNGVFVGRLMKNNSPVYWHTHPVPSTISAQEVRLKMKGKARLNFDKETSDALQLPFLLLHPKGASLYYRGRTYEVTLE